MSLEYEMTNFKPGPGPKTRRRLFDLTDAERKKVPLATGAWDYFPDALAAVAVLSARANRKFAPDEPMHWVKGKSPDHINSMARHLVDREKMDPEFNLMFRVPVAWRALADLQTAIEDLGWDAVVGADPNE